MFPFLFCLASAVILLSFFRFALPALIVNPWVAILGVMIPFLFPRLTTDYSKAALGQFLSCIILLFALPGYLYDVSAGPPETGRAWITLLLFGLTFLVVNVFFLSSRFRIWACEKAPWDRTFLVGVMLYGFAFAAFACYLFDHFRIGLHSCGEFQGLWTATQGKFFVVSGAPPTITLTEARPDVSLFGWHTKLTLFFLVPIYKIFPNPLAIYFLNSLTIAFSAVPLYLLARKKELEKLPAFLLSLSFLTAPYLIGMHVEEMQFETFGIPFVFLAFYYFEKEKFLLFFIFFLLSMTPKEEIGLCVAMFGIYALIRKRSARWIWTPLGVGIGWSLLAILVIQPWIRGDHWEIISSYGVFGATPAEIIRNMLTHPVLVFKAVFTLKKIQYFWVILSSMGLILPFLTPVGLFAVPLLLKLGLLGSFFLSSGVVHAEVRPWYAAPLVVFGYAGVVYALSKLSSRRNGSRVKELICVLLFIQLIVNINSYPFWTHLFRKELTDDFPRSYQASLKKIIRIVPGDAPVLIPAYLYSHFAQRHHVYCTELPHAKLKIKEGVDYVVLDERKELIGKPLEEVKAIKSDSRYKRVFKDRLISLYQYQ